jgi:hypothetical protein
MLTDNRCPVCGFRRLAEPPYDGDSAAPSDEICASCGYQFGYDDDARGIRFEVWRASWIAAGMSFWSSRGPAMPWDPAEDLAELRKSGSSYWRRRPRRISVPGRAERRIGQEKVTLIERVQLDPGGRLDVSARTTSRGASARNGLYVAQSLPEEQSVREAVHAVRPGAPLSLTLEAPADASSAIAFYNVWDVEADSGSWLAHFPDSGMHLRNASGDMREYDCADHTGATVLQLGIRRCARN